MRVCAVGEEEGHRVLVALYVFGLGWKEGGLSFGLVVLHFQILPSTQGPIPIPIPGPQQYNNNQPPNPHTSCTANHSAVSPVWAFQPFTTPRARPIASRLPPSHPSGAEGRSRCGRLMFSSLLLVLVLVLVRRSSRSRATCVCPWPAAIRKGVYLSRVLESSRFNNLI